MAGKKGKYMTVMVYGEHPGYGVELREALAEKIYYLTAEEALELGHKLVAAGAEALTKTRKEAEKAAEEAALGKELK